MRLIFLSSSFYDKYSSNKEILQKDDRPYVCLQIKISGTHYAIPLRHHIKHKHAFFTIGEAGLDYTKSVPLLEQSFVSHINPSINNVEWDIIKKNEQQIIRDFKKYLRLYKKACSHPDVKSNQMIIKYSTLQYFDIDTHF